MTATLDLAVHRVREAYAAIVQMTRPGPVNVRDLRSLAAVSWEDFNRAIQHMDRQGAVRTLDVANHLTVRNDRDATVLVCGNYWHALVIEAPTIAPKPAPSQENPMATTIPEIDQIGAADLASTRAALDVSIDTVDEYGWQCIRVGGIACGASLHVTPSGNVLFSTPRHGRTTHRSVEAALNSWNFVGLLLDFKP